ncbi:MAG: ferritin-like domain-containing protein, partial [Parvularculaceae bacterium]|nr:ferritin-like domain-containing protein [Parvularculaceae bacterium]
EAGHFSLISTRLGELGSHYGAMPAHGGLWDAARETSDSVLARLTIVPMVFEARGLDVTPGLGRRFHNVGDEPSARLIERILADEIGHVAAGVRWFTQVCEAKKLDAEAAFRTIVSDRFRGGLKPPFNQSARDEAGFPTSFYTGWNSPCGTAIHAAALSH